MVATLSSETKTAAVQKKTYFCPKCKTELTDRVHRSWVVKNVLFWMPAKRYFCYSCKTKHHFFR